MIPRLHGLTRSLLILIPTVAIGCSQAAPPPPPVAPASGVVPGPPTAFQKVPKKVK